MKGQRPGSLPARLRRVLLWERPLKDLGPFYLVRMPLVHLLFGWLLAAGLMFLIFRSEPLFTGEAIEGIIFWQHPLLLKALAVVVGLLFTFRLKAKGKPGVFVSTAGFVLAPFAAFAMVEFVNGSNAFARSLDVCFMNIVGYLVVYLLFLVIFGNYRWAVFFGTIFFYVFAVACYYVLVFRGTPFVPLDLLSSGTAANVAENYSFELAPRVVIGALQTGLIIACGFQLGRANLRRVRWKLTLRALAAALIIGLVATLFSQSYLHEKGYVMSYWNEHESYESYGSWFAFCINVRTIYPERPEDYDAAKVRTIVDDTLEAGGIDPDSDKAYNMLSGENDYTAGDKQPNIILIMNESFADLQSKGDGFETNEEVMPFFKSLKENTVRGNLQMSIAGGGTACSEYEVLTGNAQRFLPSGDVAYSANIHASMPSLAWTLLEQGYQTEAFHPYYISGWNRQRVYKYLGFEDYTFLEDIVPEDLIDLQDPDWEKRIEKEVDEEDGNVYNRCYMSDHYDFEIIKDLYAQRDKDKPFFLFNVTIQNHGGYEYAYTNFEEKIHITDMDGDYPWTDRYLSLINASDEAFEELITYFKEEVEEPTLIIMFGDHIPAVEQSFFDELYGDSMKELDAEELLERYQTPFVLWANYDIPEKNLGTISANYLSTLILETAGVELTDYNRYLATLFSEVPVVSSLGFIDADGEAIRRLDGGSIGSLIDDYQSVAYNNLLDYNKRDRSVFTLDGKALPDVSVTE